jgi:U3 small nucleolar RNA-associated protein 12
VGACEYVFVWDLRKGEVVLKLACDNPKLASEVTTIEQDCVNSKKLAVGYLDGSLRLFDLTQRPAFVNDFSSQVNIEQQAISSCLTFNGHKTSVTSIAFDSNGLRLATASKDTDIVIWDLVGECGLFRLKGHKAPITKAIFMTERNILISSGKDMLVKFWDLDTRHCFKTIVLHRSEVNDLILLKEDTRLITGCHDNELRVFELVFKDNEDKTNENLNHEQQEPNLKKSKILNGKDSTENQEEHEVDESNLSSMLDCNLIGSLIRESKDTVNQLCFDRTMKVFSSHSSNEKHIELYRINTPDEIKKRLSKKLKKQKRKLQDAEKNDSNLVEDFTNLAIEQTVNDEFIRMSMLKLKHKIKYVDLQCDFDDKKTSEEENVLFKCKIACLLQNNQLEIYSLNILDNLNNLKAPDLIYSISTPGHRTDVRTIAFNADSSAFLTASGDSMKVWNRMSLNCIRTFTCDYALCSLFLSDDSHILIGTKSGKIQLFNINSASMIENAIAHDDDTAVWSMCLIPDKVLFILYFQHIFEFFFL